MNAVTAIIVATIVHTIKGMHNENAGLTDTCKIVKYFRAMLSSYVKLTEGTPDGKVLFWFTGLRPGKQIVDAWRALPTAHQGYILNNDLLLNQWAHATVIKLDAERQRDEAEAVLTAISRRQVIVNRVIQETITTN